ncbi:hypothetical protein DCE93_14180 [Agromyces badenianii]|uniref:Uncharacterized protein n=1 Tax=Agromyces badenianii TaxID=2080742 RepID=A0A2S0WZ68_9MICO|nr:hypothetical protein [Agromyces badenianii]AWB96653.1 hypothetical protein DCE93_14180 [Agromyces badenianii]PWC05570.1 hypothetical protein DCE94_04715 [Agromyces badenianii]
MPDPDPFLFALNGTAVTAERIDDARAYLLKLGSLLAEMNESVHRLVPPSTGAWRSAAAGGYAKGLDELRSRVLGARDALDHAEAALCDRIRRMEAEYEVQRATLGEPQSPVARTDASWTIR